MRHGAEGSLDKSGVQLKRAKESKETFVVFNNTLFRPSTVDKKKSLDSECNSLPAMGPSRVGARVQTTVL